MANNGNTSERLVTIGMVVISLFFILVMRLWQLQILKGNEYRRTSEENRLRIVKIAAPRGIIYDRNGIPLVKNSPYYSVSVNLQALSQTDLTALSNLLKTDIKSLEKRTAQYKNSIYEPIKLKEGLSFKDIALIEARHSDFPGLQIDVDVTREYLYGSVGAHLVGYLGKLNQIQSQDPEFRDVPPDAFVGQWGVEKLYDKYLRGVPEERIIEVDALGRELRLLQGNPPVRGKDLTLALDINLQKAAEDAFGERTGALAALKPDTGEILALVSKPSFDPNVFARGIDQRQWDELNANARKPFLNRALQSQYPPGSTFKIVTSVAALEEGAMEPDTKVTCKGGIDYGRWRFGCWQKKGHGTLSFHRALVESCDVYFYEAGKRLGIDKIASYARELGLGSDSGMVLVKERKGLIPDTKWKAERKKQPWYLGETFNASIGQGYVSATPFQMARMISIIANGGYVYNPSIITIGKSPEPSRHVPVKEKTLDIVKDALCGVVGERSGTGWAARSSVARICGKTGTSQVVSGRRESKHLPELQRDHAWFVAFAPYERPEIALAVLVEHGGHGGSAAAPIAKRAIEAYLKSMTQNSVKGELSKSGREPSTIEFGRE
jgi:penicillin-binding protein 2